MSGAALDRCAHLAFGVQCERKRKAKRAYCALHDYPDPNIRAKRADKIVSTAMRWYYWRKTKGDTSVKDPQARKALDNLAKACRRLEIVK